MNHQIAAAKLGLTKYTAVAGDFALREAVAHDLFTRKNIPCTSADEILV